MEIRLPHCRAAEHMALTSVVSSQVGKPSRILI